MARSVVCCLNVGFSRLITSVGEEWTGFSAIDYSYFCRFCPKDGG